MTSATSSLNASLVRAACAVATAEQPAQALIAVLAACRECLGASGAALLQARAGRLVPLASDGLTVAERPLDPLPDDGYALRLDGRLEGLLVLAGVALDQTATGGPTLAALLDLAAAAVRRARIAEEQTSAGTAQAAQGDSPERRAGERLLGRALADSEERFRTLYQSAACGILVRNAAGETTDANQAATRIVGVPLAEMRGRTWSRAMTGATREDGTPFPEEERPLAIALRTRRPVHGVRMGLCRPEGERRWLQVDSVPVFDGDGMLTQVVTSFIDVTERKQAEEALAAAERRFRAIVEGSAEAVTLVAADGTILYATPAAESVQGYPLADLIGHSAFEHVHPDDAARIGALWAALVAEPGGMISDHLRVQHANGEWRWLEATGTNSLAEPNVEAIVVNYRDVTERKVAQDAAERERREKSALLDSAAEGIFGLDRDGRCTFINRTGAAMLGYAPAELQGADLHALMHHSHADGTPYPAEHCPVRRALATGESVHVDDEVLWRRDGTSFPAEYSAAPVWEDARITGVVMSFGDITARKEAEQRLQALTQSEKLRALGQMAGGVAHDLNQYLGLVAGHGELALRALSQGAAGQAGAVDSLNIIVQAAMDGAETVKRLLAFGRSRPEGPAAHVDVGELLREVAKLTAPRWRAAAQAQGRPISLHVEAERDLTVAGWPESLREACTNLVFNAVDALPHGGGIRLVARRQDDLVVLEVIDTGVGMTPDVRARLFEPFFSTKGERGTGLGLAMVFGIVERHGGEIAVESAPGRGSTFRLTFPAAGPDGRSAPAATAPTGIRPLHVLAVDDEPALGRMAALMLAPDGHAVVVATSAEEALEHLAVEPFDLVISDVGMGAGMNGWELAEQVRTRYPGVRFALATGWGAQIDPEEAHALGICAVLPKPYRLADMRSLAATAS
jgi:PAS domain S-box-containing protein